MGKDKSPRQRKVRKPSSTSADEQEPERIPEEKGALVPPARRPPTAVAAETPPLPPREPLPESVSALARPLLFQLLRGLRQAVGLMLDAADEAASRIKQGLQR
jgi:hypothetical protein